MNLTNKIIIITTLTIVFATGANGLFNSLIFVKSYSKSLEEQSFAIGQSLKLQLDRLLALDIPLVNLEGFENQCRDVLLKYKQIKYVMVTDPGGKILFHSDKRQHGKMTPVAKATSSSDASVTQFKINRGPDMVLLETHIPVIDPHQELQGYLIVGMPEKIIRNELNRLILSTFLSAAFLILISSLILFFTIRRYVTKPIQIFIQHIQNLRLLGPGHAAPLAYSSNDEIGKLRSEFFDLMKDLEISQRTVENHARELEEMVAKRTEELQQANQQLKLDIKARIQAEEALKESEEKSKTVIKSVQTGILIIEAQNNTIVDANPMALKLLNLSLEEIKGKESHIFIHPIFKDTTQNPQLFNLADPYEKVLKSNSGREIPIFLTRTPITLKKTPHIIENFIDLRRLKSAEKERDQLERQLQQAQKLESIGTLAGGIAHGFNNILASIIGYTELLLYDVEKGSRVEKNLQKIFMAAIRARDLVKQILAFARQTDDELKPLRIDTIAKEALKLIRSTIPVTIKIKQNIVSKSWIMGNPTQVNQIFMNLCTNAAQAMEESGGILSVDVVDMEIDDISQWRMKNVAPGKYVQIQIADTGPGISEENIELIFEPYFTTKKIGKGTGMGLAMVHGLVERYQGKTFVESQLGQGAVFTIFLPVTEKRHQRVQYTSKKLPTGTERILLVDDENLIVEVGRDLLQRLGYQITTKTNSLEAIKLFRSNPEGFDLVITDMTMPDMTGDVMAKEMLTIRPGMPIILCSGYSTKVSDQTALEMGIKAFVYKPIVREELAKTIRKVLDGK